MAAETDQPPSLVREVVVTASEILVVTPILTTRLQWLATDTDRARFEADERPSTVLSHVQAIAKPDTTVVGRVGDEQPLSVFDDAVRLFDPDHILIALRRQHRMAGAAPDGSGARSVPDSDHRVPVRSSGRVPD